MKNEALNDIKEFATKRLQQEYGYCGVMENDEMVMINSDDKDGNDIAIKITIKPE